MYILVAITASWWCIFLYTYYIRYLYLLNVYFHNVPIYICIFRFRWLSYFCNSLTHQYKSILALPACNYLTVAIYVLYVCYPTLYMSVKIVWVFYAFLPIFPVEHLRNGKLFFASTVWFVRENFYYFYYYFPLSLFFRAACPAMFSKKTPSHFAIRLSTKYLHFHLPSARKTSGR